MDAVFGGGYVDAERLRALDFTQRVVLETLRLRSPVLFSRTAVEDVELGGVPIRHGTEIGISPYALNLNPRVHPDPRRFDPGRASADAALPFGAGPHRCVGEIMALVEATTVLAVLTQHWILKPVPGLRVREHAGAQPHPGRLRLLAMPRNGTS